MINRISRISRIKATLALLWLVISTSCTPAKSPTAQDVAITAINAVDTALAIAITESTADAGANAGFERDVALVQIAADAVKAGSSFCYVVKDLEQVAADIHCTQCAAPIASAKGAGVCQ